MKPIYYYRVDLRTGDFEVSEVTDYEEKTLTNGKKYYRYKKGGSWHYVHLRDLDIFKSGRLYSFDQDKERAIKIILKTIDTKIDKTRKDLRKWMNARDGGVQDFP